MNVIESLGPTNSQNPKAQAPDALGQQDFLRLLVAQMENQDPTKPMDNFQFLSQISQFGMVDGIQNLESSFESVASGFKNNQLLEATNLIDRRVAVNSELTSLSDQTPIEGSLLVEGPADNIVVEIRSAANGDLVFSSSLGGGQRGELPFAWDGRKSDGSKASTGNYIVSGTAEFAGTQTRLDVMTINRVHGVTSSASGGINVLLESGEETDINSIKQFM